MQRGLFYMMQTMVAAKTGFAWTFANGAPNAHSVLSRVRTAEQVRRALADALEHNRGQAVQVCVWEKTGLPVSYWMDRAEALRLVH